MTMLPPALAAWLDLCLRDTPRPSGEGLGMALLGAPDAPRTLDHARFGEGAYVRVPLHRGADYEVRLLCWAPGQSSALHAHGDSACAFLVLSGEATEVRLDGSIRRLRAGEAGVADDSAVHQVGNLGAEPLVSLHVYAPPLPVDQPSAAEGRRIVILGGGFCGAALAAHLLRTGDPSLRITIVEPGAIGRGVAYGTTRDEHHLNVPAGGMSIDPAAPDDFVEFARERLPDVQRTSLLPRALYGDYVVDRLHHAVTGSPGKLRLARTTATGVRRDDVWRVALADGRVLEADEVVLATGHGPARVPAAFAPRMGHPALVSDPWAPGALDDLRRAERVLLVGTGLTAVDVASTLRRLGVPGPVHAVSRNGRWPRPHLATVRWTGPAVELGSAPATADGLAEWLRGHVREAEARGLPWQAVLEAVRPRVALLWASLPDPERARFLERHRAEWEVARHRVERPTWDALRAWRDEGWLVSHAGGVTSVQGERDGLLVGIGDGAPQRFDRVVLCCGNESDPRRFASPLWRDLIGQGLVTPDEHGLGVLTDERGAVTGADGLWALGGLQRPLWFESTAVPDLARQAAALAAALSQRGGEPARTPSRVGRSADGAIGVSR